MIACDVNILIYSYDEDAPRHSRYRAWLESAVAGPEPFGLASIVGSGFVRVVTHPKVLVRPLPTSAALDLVEAVRSAPAVTMLQPGRRHWSIFTELCRRVGARGDAVPDTYLAALAIENGCTWYTADRGFARYPGLTVRHPLDAAAQG